MDLDFDRYHVDPRTTRRDRTGRYPPNHVKFPWFLRLLVLRDSLSRGLTGRTTCRIKDSLLDTFDAVHAPAERWGSAEEIEVLRTNLKLFSAAIDQNEYVSPIGRLLIKAIGKGYLDTRAATISFYEAHREFIEANGRYEAPLIVTGFPRTGTTLLQRLLSEDPETRSPYTFEMEVSTPPLEAGLDPLQDPRIEKSTASMAVLAKLAPGFMEKFAESHLWSAVEREESFIYMLAHNGISILNGPKAGRAYIRSTVQPGVADAVMKYERNFFRMLDAYAPVSSHWTNKAPAYAAFFGKLFEYHPDARVVVTHRHPSKNFASVCRLLESWLVAFDRDGSFDKVRFGQMIQEEFAVYLSVPLAFRRASPQYESQIMDCMYQDLFRDPIGMVKRLYSQFGLKYSQEFEDRMKVYLDNNKQGKYGRHRYTNEEYGINPYVLYEHNQSYFDHYGFKAEPGKGD